MPVGKFPHMWGQSLYIVGRLIDEVWLQLSPRISQNLHQLRNSRVSIIHNLGFKAISKPLSARKLHTEMCLVLGHLQPLIFPFWTNGKSMALDIPILKHFQYFHKSQCSR